MDIRDAGCKKADKVGEPDDGDWTSSNQSWRSVERSELTYEIVYLHKVNHVALRIGLADPHGNSPAMMGAEVLDSHRSTLPETSRERDQTCVACQRLHLEVSI